MPDYVKIKEGNNWGHLSWASEDRGMITVPDEVRVRWPDGSETVEKTIVVSHHEVVGDHGQDYHALSWRRFLVVDHLGAKIHMRLDAVEVWEEDLIDGGEGDPRRPKKEDKVRSLNPNTTEFY